MAKKIYLTNYNKREICEDFSDCGYLKVDWMREKFCYRGGGCPEQNALIMKELIQRSLI